MSENLIRAKALRALAIEAVERAQSGHPGMPLGMADVMEVLWNEFLQHNPKNPKWRNRDRFVLSNGHGSMLLYAALHLSGYDLYLQELKNFRQLHSKTPGHPEYGLTPGVETTTGPLGQGLANAVGMALAERWFRSRYTGLIDHWIYCFVGDGCLMEGISHEAASFAGTQGLGRLIVFWDDNDVSIDGKASDWWKDDTLKRFEAYGWRVIPNVNGHDPAEIRAAIQVAKNLQNSENPGPPRHQGPVLIACKTKIGKASPFENDARAHGAPLGAEALAATKENLGWKHEAFVIPEELYQAWDASVRGKALETAWNQSFLAYQQDYPQAAEELKLIWNQEEHRHYESVIEALIQKLEAQAQDPSKQGLASRKASQFCLEQLVPGLPNLIGGSADLSESNGTFVKQHQILDSQNPQGNYIHYGVREFGMSAIMNGMALYGGLIPYGGTFLVFSDYARNAIRLAALMQIRVIFVLTHDSIALGEDGPTHQPIEHLMMLRNTPGLQVWRPANYQETATSWSAALSHQGPTCLILSRQALPKFEIRTKISSSALMARGAYLAYTNVDKKKNTNTEKLIIIIATGSEVGLAYTVAKHLEAQDHKVRVVSMPCRERFLQQDLEYQQTLIPSVPALLDCLPVVIEAAANRDWHSLVGLQSLVIGVDEFGASAPGSAVYEALGFSVEKISAKILKKLEEIGRI
ncbi:MAG: transketolase [Gammaproteobacteria bacterium]